MVQKEIAVFAEEKQVSTKKPESYVEAAMQNRRQQPLYLTDEDGNETGDVAGQSGFPELAELVHSYIKREFVSISLLQKAFAALKDDMNKDLIEDRIGCCMECCCPKTIVTFEELAMTYEFTSPSAAMMAYERALEKLTANLQKKGEIRVRTFRRTQETKSPPLSTNIRQTTMTNGARSILIFGMVLQRSAGLQTGTPPKAISMQRQQSIIS